MIKQSMLNMNVIALTSSRPFNAGISQVMTEHKYSSGAQLLHPQKGIQSCV
jgi:hypothetical protein